MRRSRPSSPKRPRAPRSRPTRRHKMDDRLLEADDWLADRPDLKGLPLGYFGASTGGAGALIASARRPSAVRAVVSRGGRPDLAGRWLGQVGAPPLLIAGGADDQVIPL